MEMREIKSQMWTSTDKYRPYVSMNNSGLTALNHLDNEGDWGFERTRTSDNSSEILQSYFLFSSYTYIYIQTHI